MVISERHYARLGLFQKDYGFFDSTPTQMIADYCLDVYSGIGREGYKVYYYT
jgi:hypothetical protein